MAHLMAIQSQAVKLSILTYSFFAHKFGRIATKFTATESR